MLRTGARSSAVLALNLLAASWLWAAMPGEDPQAPTPGKAPGTIPPERTIFVPIWTDSVGKEKGLPTTVRRERADQVWTGVTLPASRVAATIHPQGAEATLIEFRRAAAARSTGGSPALEVIIRMPPSRGGTKPFLELVDTSTLLQSRGWGRLLRTTPGGSDWAFVLPDPMPAPTAPRNPVSARVDLSSRPGRSFELRLVTSVREQM